MTIYVFRVWLQPNPLLGFEPDEEVWRDIEINGSHTLAAFHEAIFDAFKRWDSHAYEFITRDKEGIALRSYVHPHLYDGGVGWPPMDDGEIGRFIDRAVPDDAAAEAKERFRDLQRNPRRKATPRTRRSRNSTPNNWARSPYTFDMGDGWEHSIDLQEAREGSLDGGPAVVNEQGEAPPQYRDLDDDQ